jgi:hypothetical protein
VVKQQLFAPQAVNFPCDRIRSLFPALAEEPGFIFFDNGAGAQIPQGVFDAINGHLLHRNVQRGGRYAKSMEVDATIARARESVAALINARHCDEIAFGMNVLTRPLVVSPRYRKSARRTAPNPSAVFALLADRGPDRSRDHRHQHLSRGGPGILGSEFHPVPAGDYHLLLDNEAKEPQQTEGHL